jgi:hypothetical protein
VDALYNNVLPCQESKHDSWDEKPVAQFLKPTEFPQLTFYKPATNIRHFIKIRKVALYIRLHISHNISLLTTPLPCSKSLGLTSCCLTT